MSRVAHCQNCNETISKNFCANCGQKTDTHRITLKHFFAHDIIHGVWHFERGIFFTLKEAIIRPGQAALDYIGGKRIRYYNVFYLSLLLIALNILLKHYYSGFDSHAVEDETPNVTHFFANNIKLLLFSIIPVLGLNSWLVFRRLKLNIAEHFIIGGMCLLGILFTTIGFLFFDFLSNQLSAAVFGILEVACFVVILLYPVWTYQNAVKNIYTIWGTFWRTLVFYMLILLEIVLLLFFVVYCLTGGRTAISVNI